MAWEDWTEKLLEAKCAYQEAQILKYALKNQKVVEALLKRPKLPLAWLIVADREKYRKGLEQLVAKFEPKEARLLAQAY